MRVLFGLALDGPAAPEAPWERDARVGETTQGPSGLLSLLETRLGLGGAWDPEPLRVAQLAARLALADDGRRFYSRSRAVDPLGTARTLLAWRESLFAAGWSGGPVAGATPRLADLAALEQLPGLPPLCPGPAERLQTVLGALARRDPGLRALGLACPEEELPRTWREVVAALRTHGCTVEPPATPERSPCQDLARLQTTAGRPDSRPPLGDGSVVLLTAGSDSEAAATLAGWLEAHLDECALIVPAGDDSLDRALAMRGLPPAGAAPVSRWRPPLQVLPLAIALRWEPLDPQRLLEFLMLPGGPLPPFAAARLANALVQAPGVGGPAWLAALERLDRTCRERFLKERGPGAEAAAEREAARLRERLDEWLAGPRFRPEDGLPATELTALCGQVIRWAHSGPAANDPALQAASSQATALKRMVEHLGEPRLPRLLCEALMEDATAAGVPLPGCRSERGHPAVIHQPGAVVGPVERLVWWDFASDGTTGALWEPWTRQERMLFAAAGLALEELSAWPRRHAAAAFRAFAWCRHQLVLVQPERRRGQPAGPHPLLASVRAAFGGHLRALTHEARPWLQDQARSAGLPGPLEPVTRRTLPPLRRWWTLPAGVIASSRPVESYTGLEAYLYHPHLWVLEYAARLDGGASRSLPSGNRLLGSLAHRLLQDFLTEPGHLGRPLTAEQIDCWMRARLPGLLAGEGAALLLPGHEPEVERLRTAVTRSARVLSSRLAEHGWNPAAAEARRTGNFSGGGLEGTLDLLLQNAGGELAVLDLKWGGRRYRSRELATGEALQLLVYAHLSRQTGPDASAWPRTAFFILEEAALLPARALDPVPAEPARRGPAPREQAWSLLERVWAWRRGLLEAGRVEVTVPGTEPDESSLPDFEGFEPREYHFDKYATLVGWPGGER